MAEAGERHLRLAALLLLAGAVLLAFGDVLGPERGLYFRDHSLVFKPLWYRGLQQLQAGQLPILDSYGATGTPTERSVAASFYSPLVVVFGFGAFESAYDWFILGHYLFLGLGAFLLARSLGAPVVTATLVAVASALLGPVIAFENLVTSLQGLVVTPWIAWASLRVLRGPGLGSAAVLALAIGLQAQSLMPELLLLDLGLFGALALREGRRPTGAQLLALIAAASLGLGIAAVDLLPQLAGLQGSRRLGGFGYEERSGWCLSPLGLLELLAPAFWAPPSLPFANVPLATGAANDPPYLTSLYLGTLLPIVAAAPWRQRRCQILGGAALFFLLVAMGTHTPVHRWLTELPLLRSGRYAVKYLLLVVPALVALAAVTLSALEHRAKVMAASAFAQTCALAVALSVAGSEGVQQALAERMVPVQSAGLFEGIGPNEASALALDQMQSALTHGAVFSLLLLLIALLALRSPARVEAIRWAVVVLVAVDLGLAAQRVILGAGPEAQSLPPEAVQLVRGPHQRVLLLPPHPVVHQAGRTYFEDRVAALGRAGFNRYQDLRRFYPFSFDGQGNPVSLAIADLYAKAQPIDAPVILGRFGVSHVLSAGASERGVALTFPDADGRPVRIYSVEGVLPWAQAFVGWQALPLRDGWPQAWLQAARERSQGVVLGSNLTSRRSTRSDCAPTVDARWDPVDPTGIEVNYRSACEALVVVREVAVEGWSASIDGRDAPLLTADAGYLAALVPTGEHQLRFQFRALAPTAAKVSLASLALTLLALARSLRRRRSPAT